MTLTMNFRLRLASAALLFGVLGVVRADVTVDISSQTGQVGAPLQLQYSFNNVGEPRDMPRSIMVDGLDIRLTGKSRRVEMINFQSTTRMIYSYTVTPNRPGNFTIPGFAVQLGGRQLRTQPVNLRVTGPGGVMPPAPAPGLQQQLPPPRGQQQMPQQQLPPSSRQPSAPGRKPPVTADGQPAPYYGEIVMGARTAYVGEVIPVELRFYFRADCQFDNLQRPSFGGDGFTAAPLTEPEQTEQFIDDIPYNIVTFRSAITPVKTGEIEIPAATMEGRMIAPGGPAGFDPFFDQFFQNFPVPGFGRAENIQATTNRRQLEVQALPREGRPDNFAGAIGQFTMKSAANPKKAGAGEPVALTLTVEGRGNFDAIVPPELTGSEGWRSYAPKETFKAADAIGYGGTKTFEISLIAREDREATPGAEFSYFDPLKKKYFTLKTDPVAVAAAGAGAAADRAVAGQDTTREDDLPALAAGPDDIAAPAVQPAGSTRGFVPWVETGWFRLLNLAVLAAVILSVPWLVWMKRRARKSEQTVALEAQVKDARAGWHKATTGADFYRAAADYVEARLALLEGKPVALVDAAAALERRVSDPLERRELQSVLARRDEMNYGGGGDGPLDAVERNKVTALLDKFARNHG